MNRVLLLFHFCDTRLGAPLISMILKCFRWERTRLWAWKNLRGNSSGNWKEAQGKKWRRWSPPGWAAGDDSSGPPGTPRPPSWWLPLTTRYHSPFKITTRNSKTLLNLNYHPASNLVGAVDRWRIKHYKPAILKTVRFNKNN